MPSVRKPVDTGTQSERGTFIVRCASEGTGPRLAVKDVVDVAGTVTTVGSVVLAERAPATHDAACVATARAGGARIVGKTNLHELCLGASGVNPWFGTPVNPLAPDRIPGGSSSGSAAAVAGGEADVALGSDTAGSVRIPAACCGIAGLKTTWGRVPMDGVYPLAPSLDTVGPLAPDVGALVAGMTLLEPGFAPAPPFDGRVGRFRPRADPDVDDAIDHALATAGLDVVDVDLPAWEEVAVAGSVITLAEASAVNRDLAQRPERFGGDVVAKLRAGLRFDTAALTDARVVAQRWRDELAELFSRIDVLALPTVPIPPPRLDDDLRAAELELIRLTVPVNVAGLPALAVPVPAAGLPASLQLVGPAGSEARLLSAAALVERAVGRLPGRPASS